MQRESTIPTPFAVCCKEGCKPEKKYLTEQEYIRQLDKPNSLWQCPSCGGVAMWDDENYDEHIDKED